MLNGCAQASGAVVQGQSSWLSADDKWQEITGFSYWFWFSSARFKGGFEHFLRLMEIDGANFARSLHRRAGIRCCLFGPVRLLPATRSGLCAQLSSANASVTAFTTVVTISSTSPAAANTPPPHNCVTILGLLAVILFRAGCRYHKSIPLSALLCKKRDILQNLMDKLLPDGLRQFEFVLGLQPLRLSMSNGWYVDKESWVQFLVGNNMTKRSFFLLQAQCGVGERLNFVE